MGVRIEDLQLVWPRDLFVQEFRAATLRSADPWGGHVIYSPTAKLDLLFSEAFYDDAGAQWLAAAREEGALEALVTEIHVDPARVPTFTRPVAKMRSV